MGMKMLTIAAAALATLAIPGAATAQGYPAYGYPGGYGHDGYADREAYRDRHEERRFERERRREDQARRRAWARAHRHGYDRYDDRY